MPAKRSVGALLAVGVRSACAAAVLLLVVGAAAQPTEAPGFAITLGPDVAGGNAVADALRILFMLTAIALIPAILIAMTSFTRTIIVLSMLRQAFGMPDTPPNMVLVSMALFLTLFSMSPVLSAAYRDGIAPLMEGRATIEEASTAGIAPFRDFMLRQTRDSDLVLILDIANVPVPETPEELRTVHIVPAFLLSELKTAFQIGFIIFLPFLLLDVVVASILMSMGMLMVPPSIISLPLKIMMFVLIDGWALTVRALLGSFQ
jgi:flagellar biosynthetic protein FliP